MIGKTEQHVPRQHGSRCLARRELIVRKLADCKSMNLIYQLQCTECNFFYIGETRHSLSDCMNGHHFTTTVSNPDLPVAITPNPTRSLSRNAGLLVSYTNSQTPPLTAFASNLKQHINSSSNHVTPLISTSVNPPLPPSLHRHL